MQVREATISPNHCCAVALASQVQDNSVGLELWQQPIVLFRDSGGKVHALEACCPHRLVKFSRGKVIDDQLECAYHGWCIDRVCCLFAPID